MERYTIRDYRHDLCRADCSDAICTVLDAQSCHARHHRGADSLGVYMAADEVRKVVMEQGQLKNKYHKQIKN